MRDIIPDISQSDQEVPRFLTTQRVDVPQSHSEMIFEKIRIGGDVH
jgi:hypothetical protein